MSLNSVVLSFGILFLVSYADSRQFEFIQAGRLPVGRAHTSVIYDGDDSVYIVSGQTGILFPVDDVLKYNLTSSEVTHVGNVTPGRYDGGGGVDGSGNMFFFGGNSFNNNSGIETHTTIFKFTTDDPQPVEVGNMPNPSESHATVSDGNGSIYLLGGIYWLTVYDSILRYDTATGYTYSAGRLPQPIGAASAAWVDGSIYLFGGYSEGWTDNITKFRVEDGLTENIGVWVAATFSSAVAVGSDIYIIGGIHAGNTFLFSKFNTLNNALEHLQQSQFEFEIHSASSVYIEKLNRIYIFGGESMDPFAYLPEIYYVEL